jgi:hypothetical protein
LGTAVRRHSAPCALDHLLPLPNIDQEEVAVYGVGGGAATASMVATSDPRITALILDSNVRPPRRGNRCTDFDKAAELGDAVGRRLIWDTLAWAGIIGVPTNCAAQEGTAKRLKGGPFAVVFAGAVATCSGLKKIGFVAHRL